MTEREHNLISDNELSLNYLTLKTKLSKALADSRIAPDPRSAKEVLILVQGEFKGLRLAREDREELYGTLQEEFDRVNQALAAEKQKYESEAQKQYLLLKEEVERAIIASEKNRDNREAKHILIEAQNMLKGSRLMREQREQLFQTLQEAFAVVNKRMEVERESFQLEAEENYAKFSKIAGTILESARNNTEFKTIREEIRSVQNLLRDARMQREHKDLIYSRLQDAFTLVNARQDEDRMQFEKEASKNFEELNKWVEEGLLKAHESNEYKETREFLKKIQNEFRGRKLIREERELLYSRLQTAFAVLNKRIDTFFREKKKNWEVKMQFKLKEFEVTIQEIYDKIEKEEQYLQELETQIDILGNGPHDHEIREKLVAKVLSVKNSIRKNFELAALHENERDNLRQRLESPLEDEEN